MPKYTPSEALRKTIERTQADALAALAGSEKETYDKIVEGDGVAIKEARRAKLGTPLYDAANYMLADYADLQDTIQRYEDPQPATNPLAAAASGAPNNTSVPALPKKKGLPGLTPQPSTPTPAPTPSAAPSTLHDVAAQVTQWRRTYGNLQGAWESDVIEAVLSKGSKSLTREIMDLGVFTADSLHEVKYQKQGKVYRKGEADVKKVPWYGLMMLNGCTEQFELLFEHPEGKKMWQAATPDLHLQLVRFAFDTRNTALLQSILDTGLNVATLRDYKNQTPLMCDLMYRADEEDLVNLELLVQHGADLNALDVLQSTPLIVAARMGNKAGMEFLLSHVDKQDLYAVNTMNESALTLSEKGPAKRQEAQEHYDYEIEAAKERFQEKLDAWQVQAAAAEAAGKQPPDKPQEPKFKPRPEDYPVEIYEMVKTAWDAGDPSQSAQRKAIEESEKPHEFAIDFNVNF